MKKGLRWIKNHRVTAGIIAVFLVVAGGIFAVLMGWWSIIDPKGATSQGELLRNLILCIGAIGGVYGLHLATERQKTFSHQGFNDRLGRGVELLANESVVMRCAGIRVLVDLIDSSNEAQKTIVGNIIYDFFRYKAFVNIEDVEKIVDKQKLHAMVKRAAATSIYNKHESRREPEREGRQDIQNALDFLVNVSVNERKSLYPNWLLGGRLNLTSLDFRHLDFSGKTLKSINFSHSYFREANFNNVSIENSEISNAIIKSIKFHKVNIKQSSFKSGKITNSVFSNVSFEKVDFSSVKIISTDIENSNIIGVKFSEIKFEQGKFESKNVIKVSSKDDLPYFTSTDLGATIFDFDDEIEPKDFFDLCYYRAKQKSSKIDTSRRYYFLKGGIKVFVKSKEPCSGSPVKEQVYVERVERKQEEQTKEADWQERARHMPEQEPASESELEYANRLLERAKEHVDNLKKRQAKKTPKLEAKKPKPNPKTPK